MPGDVNFPGVYIEESPSGVRTITGVATSITGFVGWAAKGPVDRAELVLDWPDYERKFGGLDKRSLLGHAVSHFFSNGGQRAYIVRLVTAGAAAAADNAATAGVTLDGKLTVIAKNPGSWGGDYAIVTKKRTDDATRFQVKIVNHRQDPRGVPIEVFDDLSMNAADARHVVSLLNTESLLVSAELLGTPADPPADTVFGGSGELPAAAKLTGGADGTVLEPNEAAFENAVQPTGGAGGVYHLDRIGLFNLLCVPGETSVSPLAKLQKFCRDRRAFLIADCPSSASFTTLQNGPGAGLAGDDAINAAFYFPWVSAPDPLQENRPAEFPPCGFVAGLYARIDSSRGVWKAPAGTEASLVGVLGAGRALTNAENAVLNSKAVNCIRDFPVYGTVVWGARTMQGSNERGSEWKYVPVRRTALFIEETLYRALKWVEYEPNDEPLWARIRLNAGAFMLGLFRRGAFQGRTPEEAYFVKCDKETTTQNDIDRGIVNVIVGFAPSRPAEFVIIQIQQIAGQIHPEPSDRRP